MVQELTESEKAELAREIAADKYAGCYPRSRDRQAFIDGWNAAMDHLKEQRDSCLA